MNFPLIVILAIVFGIVLEAVLLYFFINMLKDTGCVRKNYKGKDIPVSLGITFPIIFVLAFFIYALLNWYNDLYHLFIFAVMSICFLGFIDDMLGQRDTLGFKGHFGSLFRGKLTTGGLKALGGGMIALFTAWFISPTFIDLIINTIIIALFTNLLNLFDLRPGRAVKAFIFFFIIIALTTAGNIEWLIIAPLIGAVLMYFNTDLKAHAMMGDSGSNVLGFSLGFIVATGAILQVKIIFLVFLIAIHIYTEKYSLTKTIEKYSILRSIDNMGRG
ncbi:Phospho-N-acetylmuramoyl-pentapeptide-transferase [Candidatus Syntrophocurvum alkaliphilum]|uniref:Phospho-N-acetylmuramoyl-pentapeptide-transferase n=1 Tax=Candidatus Syntrophocurvum alkaliphilum TaxID=2293317 RepID=A0A6I6DCY4_9FIRM|nr:hypothetical protein [Candidatus Syntrophocurvum alkaliphilum]QGT98980.1 Phospho-N-acetylmuramoyl-pentapeptide-transferase [Candidatus Syntrophocurvum alkaliphilum]